MDEKFACEAVKQQSQTTRSMSGIMELATRHSTTT